MSALPARATSFTGDTNSTEAEQANRRALELIGSGQPILIGVRPAIEVIPALAARTILTSGAPMPWVRYTGGQRAAVIRSALFEGLATDELQANELLGELEVAGCHDYGCVGSLASVTTPSIPVLVVEDAGTTDRAYCTLFEGSSPARLNYGVYNEQVKQTLLFLERVVV